MHEKFMYTRPAQVSATVRAVNLAAVETALTAGDAPSKLDGALRQQIGSTLTAGTLKVTQSPATELPLIDDAPSMMLITLVVVLLCGTGGQAGMYMPCALLWMLACVLRYPCALNLATKLTLRM